MGLVRFDFHAAASAVALLATPQLPVDVFQTDRDARRQPGKSRYQAFAVRLACCLKTQH
jgi:hypothetical protein